VPSALSGGRRIFFGERVRVSIRHLSQALHYARTVV
jgi:hypothetical protein